MRLLLRSLILPFALLMFWVGLMRHFPGEEISQYAAVQLNRESGVRFSLSPVELRWNYLYIEQVTIRGPLHKRLGTWVAFHDTQIPISSGLLWALDASTQIGEPGQSGRISLTWEWEEQAVQIDARSIPLEAVPAIQGMTAGDISGTMRLMGTIQPTEAIPEGEIQVQVTDLAITDLTTQGLTIPTTRLDEALFKVQLGPIVQLEELRLSGDIAGRVIGELTPNLTALPRSRIDFQYNLMPRPAWTASWGDLAIIVESFLRSGRLEGRITGTPQQPYFQTARSRP